MVSKNEVKYIQSLCHKKQRNEDNVFVAEGVKIVDELLMSSYSIQKFFATEDWLKEHDLGNISSVEVSLQELEKISSLQTPQKVLAIIKQKENKLPSKMVKPTLVLDGIQDPGNFGTIIRIADWFGIENILCTNNTVDVYNSKVIQGSMGSFIRVNVYYGDILNEVLVNSNQPILGAVLNGNNVYQASKMTNGFLIIGNEGKGISDAMINCITNPVTIPKMGQAESLNAAVATGILLSHLI